MDDSDFYTYDETIFDLLNGNSIVFSEHVVFDNHHYRIIVVYNHVTSFNVYITNGAGGFQCIDNWNTSTDRVKDMTAADLWNYCAARYADTRVVDDEDKGEPDEDDE